MIAQLLVPALMAWTGWTFLTPFTTAWLISQLPLAVIVVGRLAGVPPGPARGLRPVFVRPARRAVIVVRPTEAAVIAAWRSRARGRSWGWPA